MSGEALRILLVEDNDDHAELVKRSLRSHRVANQVWHVSDGQEALDFLYRQEGFVDPLSSPRPHVILLDLRLPKVDGLDVLASIKESTELREIPVVILTTSRAERDVAKAYAHHVNSYLVKPVDFTQFNELMDTLGFYWLAYNELPSPGKG